MKYLKTHAWNLQAAVSDYFENPPSQKKTAAAPASTTTTFSESTVKEFFEKYQSEETKKETQADKKEIDAEGIMQFFGDLGIDPESDLVTLVVANKIDAQRWKFTQEEFTRGMRHFQCDSVVKLKKKIPAMRQELLDAYAFKSVYEYAFEFSKGGKSKGAGI